MCVGESERKDTRVCAGAFVCVCDCVGALNGAAVCLFSVLCVCVTILRG